MFNIEGGVHRTNGSCTKTHKKILIHYIHRGKMWNLPGLYCINYNKIKMSHLDVESTSSIKMTSIFLNFCIQDRTKDCGCIMRYG